MTGARTVRWWAFALLVALAAPIGWLVFVADGWTVNRLVVAVWSRAAALGVQASPEQTDGVLNFLMLVPSALLASLWLPRGGVHSAAYRPTEAGSTPGSATVG